MNNNNCDKVYENTLNYLFTKLPMYQRQGKVAFKKNLTNITKLCNALNNPQKKFKSIHIAGTNGKGSTASMLSAIFQQAGYKTGLYTSPHYLDFRERIRINGALISKAKVNNFVSENKALIEELKPSFFEITAAMAFQAFANEKVDIAIIETGLGGRLDSTNIITPILSIITNIAFDHTDMLGNTLPLIANEKAGIIKKDIPVVIGEKHSETKNVFIQKAYGQKSEIYFAEDILEVELLNSNLTYQSFLVKQNDLDWFKDLKLDLLGKYQIQNLRTVLTAITVLNKEFKVSDIIISKALKKVASLSGLVGRFQIIKKNPLIIADAAHNVSGIKKVINQLSTFGYENIIFVIGFVKDKDISSILNLLPKQSTYIATAPLISRKLCVNELSIMLTEKKIKHIKALNVNFALSILLFGKQQNATICIIGSSFLAADALNSVFFAD